MQVEKLNGDNSQAEKDRVTRLFKEGYVIRDTIFKNKGGETAYISNLVGQVPCLLTKCNKPIKKIE